MADRHTLSDLQQMQSLPLKDKIKMTNLRITQWVEEYGEDGVYVSFSGGKDSTVLLTLVRDLYPNVKAVFIDTGLEYPEIRQFVKRFDNVEWLKPNLTFRQVIEKYGYPFISKEVSECVYGARKYLRYLQNENPNFTWKELLNYADETSRASESNHAMYKYRYDKLCGIGEFAKHGDVDSQLTDNSDTNKNRRPFNCERYKFFLDEDAPAISNQCCIIMKKIPARSYHAQTGENPLMATMASESKLRIQSYLKDGCNAFKAKRPKSTPMVFWTEQDVLLYIKEHDVPMCSVYGDVVEDYEAEGITEGQMDLSDYGLFDKKRHLLKTTGCERTGCMFCGYSCHREKSPSRFEKMKKTHLAQYKYIMKPWNDGGLGYKEVIDWINEHGNLHIKY